MRSDDSSRPPQGIGVEQAHRCSDVGIPHRVEAGPRGGARRGGLARYGGPCEDAQHRGPTETECEPARPMAPALDVDEEQSQIRIPCRGIAREPALQDVTGPHRHLGTASRSRRRSDSRDRRIHHQRGHPLAIGGFPEGRTQRPLVGARVGRARELFRSHVRGRAEHVPGRRQWTRGIRRMRRVRDVVFLLHDIGGACEAEVGDAQSIVAVDEQIAGLAIAMHQPRFVRGGEPLQALDRQCEQTVEPSACAGRIADAPVVERTAGDELHRDVEAARVFAGLVHRDDVRMIQAREDLRLPSCMRGPRCSRPVPSTLIATVRPRSGSNAR